MKLGLCGDHGENVTRLVAEEPRGDRENVRMEYLALVDVKEMRKTTFLVTQE